MRLQTTNKNDTSMSILLLKPQVSVTVTHGMSVVGVAAWPVILTGWPVTGDGGRGQPASSRR